MHYLYAKIHLVSHNSEGKILCMQFCSNHFLAALVVKHVFMYFFCGGGFGLIVYVQCLNIAS